MTVPPPATSRLGFDAFGTSVGFALIAGALSVEIHGLRALVGALAALALAGWSSTRPWGPGGRGRRLVSRGAALAALGASAGFYLFPPAGADVFAGFVLAIGLVPLWALERVRVDRTLRAPGAG